MTTFVRKVLINIRSTYFNKRVRRRHGDIDESGPRANFTSICYNRAITNLIDIPKHRLVEFSASRSPGAQMQVFTPSILAHRYSHPISSVQSTSTEV